MRCRPRLERAAVLGLSALLALVDSACGPSDVVLTLPPEALNDGVLSYVLLVEDVATGRIDEAEGRPIKGGLVRLTLEDAANKRLRLLTYAATLDENHLNFGRLERDSTGEGQPLPVPSLHFSAELSDDPPRWQPVAVVDPSEIGFRRPPDPVDPCAIFESKPWEIEELPLSSFVARPSPTAIGRYTPASTAALRSSTTARATEAKRTG